MHPDFIPPAPKLGDHVRGQKTGIAAGNIDVQVRDVQEAVQHVLELGQELHLVDDQQMGTRVGHALLDKGQHHVRVAQMAEGAVVQGNLDEMRRIEALFRQIPVEQLEEQIGLARAAQAGHDFDHAVPSAADEFV